MSKIFVFHANYKGEYRPSPEKVIPMDINRFVLASEHGLVHFVVTKFPRSVKVHTHEENFTLRAPNMTAAEAFENIKRSKEFKKADSVCAKNSQRLQYVWAGDSDSVICIEDIFASEFGAIKSDEKALRAYNKVIGFIEATPVNSYYSAIIERNNSRVQTNPLWGTF